MVDKTDSNNSTLVTRLKPLIKVTSIGLISGAIALSLGALYGVLTDVALPAIPAPILALGGFAVVAHLIEAIIAARMAPARRRSALSYAVYTFFVGTVGLQELMMLDLDADESAP